MAHFDPWGAAKPCWHCSHYLAMTYGGTAALCSLPNGPRVRSSPLNGCSAWEREVGSDDEPDQRPAPADIAERLALNASTRPRSSGRRGIG